MSEAFRFLRTVPSSITRVGGILLASGREPSTSFSLLLVDVCHVSAIAK